MMERRQRSLKCYKLSKNAKIPHRASRLAAGLDLFSAYSYRIPPGEKVKILTDISILMPQGCYGRIVERSSSALDGIIIGGGVVDLDYRGNIAIICFNLGKMEVVIRKHDRIAQLICEKIHFPRVEEIDYKPPPTERNDSGFGSTGK